MAMYKNAGKKMAGKKMVKKGFTPCSRCPNPASCKRAGVCLAKAIG